MGVASGATSPLPPTARTALDGELADALFLGLNRAVWGEGGLSFPQAHPSKLADRWRFAADSTRLTYHLAPDARWSDGEAVTAADVVFTFELLADDSLALPLSYVTEEMDSVTAAGDTSVTFHFRRRYPGMLFDTGVGVLPEHLVADLAPSRLRSGQVFREHPDSLATTGPFRLGEWRADERIVLLANPAGRVAPRLDTVVIRVLPEETTRLRELRGGGLHFVQVDSYREAGRLEASERFRVHRMPKRVYDFVAWNPDGHTAFGSRAVREALSLAIDRREIIGALDLDRYATPASGPYGPLYPRLRVRPDGPLHAPSRADSLLTAAGWERTGGDGPRTKGEERLSFELAVPGGGDLRPAAAQMIQAQLAEVGVEARLRTHDFSSLFGRMRSGDYEAAMLGWQVGLDPDISPFWYDARSPVNVVGYQDARVRALIDSARASPTRELAVPHWREAARRIASDFPYAFLWHRDVPYAATRRLRAVRVGVAGFGRSLHEWWLAPPGEEDGGG